MDGSRPEGVAAGSTISGLSNQMRQQRKELEASMENNEA